ncbi:MAG: hypothetical protein ACE5GI_04410, partial [Candidatus Aminicenantales bacterium]
LKIPTFLISDRNDFVARSRWVRPIYLHANRFPTVKELTRLFEKLKFDRAVLFACSDAWTKAVANLDSELSLRFPSSIPSAEIIDIFLNKGKFGKILEQIKIPHPETIIVESLATIKNLDKKYFGKYFLKPCNSREFSYLFNKRVFRIYNHEDALAKFQRISEAGQSAVLQEYIPGPPNEHYFIEGFVDRTGTIRAVFARRRERIYPQYFGDSSYSISVPLREVSEAMENLEKLLKYVGYRGIFGAEFKVDKRDNLFKIIEVNARPWWYVGFVTQCGMNICKLAYQDALVLPVNTTTKYKEGIGCMNTFLDLKVIIKEYKCQKLSIKSWLWEFLASKKPIFSWADPMPAIFRFFEIAFIYTKKLFCKVVKLINKEKNLRRLSA